MSLLFRPMGRSSAMTPAVVSALVFGLVSVLSSTAVTAELPSAVAAEVADDGVFVSPDPAIFDPTVFDAGALAAVVASARSEGLDLVIVAPADPAPDPGAFALRVRQATAVEAVLLFGPGGEIDASVDGARADRVAESLVAAREATSPSASAERFVGTLTTEPERGLSRSIQLVIALVVALVVLLVGASVLERAVRR